MKKFKVMVEVVNKNTGKYFNLKLPEYRATIQHLIKPHHFVREKATGKIIENIWVGF